MVFVLNFYCLRLEGKIFYLEISSCFLRELLEKEGLFLEGDEVKVIDFYVGMFICR